jgi:predicted transcriptional regulator
MDVTLQIEPSTLDAIDELASKSNQPRDMLVEEALRNFVELRAWQIAKIEEGIAAADRGEFATEEELDAIEAKLILQSVRPVARNDPHLASLNVLLEEWNSPEDAEAFDDL